MRLHCNIKSSPLFCCILSLAVLCATALQAQLYTVDSSGYRLQQFYLSQHVEQLWQKGHDIDWQTGIAKSDGITNNRTYCARFVAATCKKLHIYTLQPTPYTPVFGANKLYDWLDTREARKEGWKPVEGADMLQAYCTAQQYANTGMVVIAIYKDYDGGPGHAALVRPATITHDEVQRTGPVLIQAGGFNSDSTNLYRGFKRHIHEWPSKEISLYYHNKVL